MTDLAFTPALEQARMIRDGETTSTELTEMYLERIDRLNPALASYLTVAADQALIAAKEADATTPASPLHGVPVSVKDLIDTAGIRTTHGTKGFADRVPDSDTAVVAKVRSHHMPILGKTNTPEFGSSIVSEPDGYDPARNPWNPELSPGGSSGGAAAAAIAGLCGVSVGSDGGGSIRIPSSWCGCFGIKPSRGRVSDAPSANHWYAQTGPIARTVGDAAALLDVLSGYVTGDAFTAPPPSRPFLDEVGADVGRLRIAVSTTHTSPTATTNDANRIAAEKTAALLSDLGHEVVETAPPLMDLPAVMLIAAAGSANRTEPPVEMREPINQMLVQMAKMATAADLDRVMNEIADVSRTIIAWFDDYDMFLTPTVADYPPAVGDFRRALQENPADVALILDKVPFTPVWNQTGQPAISVPLFTDDDGFPVGVQFVGRPFDEAGLIRLGAQLEAAQPWADRRPPNV